MQQHLPYWLAAMHMRVKPNMFLTWLKQFPSIQELFAADRMTLEKIMLPQQANQLRHPAWARIHKDIAWMQKPSHTILTYEDEKYPLLLKELYDPPLILFVQGAVDQLNQLQIAIVGSRRPSVTGRRNAESFAEHLASAGLIITSGLARGIDGASHTGALRAKGGTIAVTGTGLEHVYPPEHRKLREQIIECGAILSEFPLDTPPLPYNFPRRNRIISGLARGVLVVEAAMKSGSLITAHSALEQGREVYAIPGSIHTPQAKGCHYLLRHGAKLTESPEDILEDLLPQLVLHCPKVIPAPTELNESICSIIDHFGEDITPLDVIILRSGLTASEVSSILLILELEGYIELVPGGYVRTGR